MEDGPVAKRRWARVNAGNQICIDNFAADFERLLGESNLIRWAKNNTFTAMCNNHVSAGKRCIVILKYTKKISVALNREPFPGNQVYLSNALKCNLFVNLTEKYG